MVVAVMSRHSKETRPETGTPRRQDVIAEAVANMAVDERPLPVGPDNFSRYSSYLVNNARNGAGSNGVDGFGFQRRGAEHDQFYWTDTLQIDSQASGPNAPPPFQFALLEYIGSETLRVPIQAKENNRGRSSLVGAVIKYTVWFATSTPLAKKAQSNCRDTSTCKLGYHMSPRVRARLVCSACVDYE